MTFVVNVERRYHFPQLYFMETDLSESPECAACHGPNGQGSGNIPAVSMGPTQSAPDGEVFWFLTTGSISNGMPAWGSLSEEKRWQIVAFLKSLKNSGAAVKSFSVEPAVTAHPRV
jgi:mono/diheme cytochrome c family protein